MRAAWKGYITLGQLGIPVRLYSATRSARPNFVLLHEKDGSPLERILQSKNSSRPVPSSEVVKAVEYEPGRHVTLTSSELAGSGAEDTKTIDIKQFSDLQDVNPSYYEKPYYIVPSKGGERAYALLREALSHSRKIAISQFQAFGRDHIGAISGLSDLLVLYQLRFASEIIPRNEIKSPAIPKASPAEIDALIEVIDRFNGPFYIHDYRDEQTDRINLLVERKIKGLPLPREERPSPQATPEQDLLPVLRSTLNGSGQTVSATTAQAGKTKKGAKNAAVGPRTKR